MKITVLQISKIWLTFIYSFLAPSIPWNLKNLWIFVQFQSPQSHTLKYNHC